MLATYKKRPENFKRKIIEYISNSDRKFLLERENYWLSHIKLEELGKKYYNLKKVAAGGDIVSGLSEDKKKQHRERSIQVRRNGYIKWLENTTFEIRSEIGKKAAAKRPDDSRKRAAKTYSERYKGENHPSFGSTMSEANKKKLSIRSKDNKYRLGGTFTDESKYKIKMNNPNRKSFYTPDGLFLSSGDYEKNPGKLTGPGILNIIKDRFIPITKNRAARCILFSDDDIGKTPFELGYKYENEL